MSRYFFYIFLIGISSPILAQASSGTDSLNKWSSSSLASLTFSQLRFSNWSSGGQSSFTANGMFAYHFSYKDSTMLWDNSFYLAYGVIREGSVKSLAKSDDRIELNTSYGWSAFKNWYYNFSFNFRSQAAKGYDSADKIELISDFLAPAYSTISLGMSYQNRAKSLSFQLLPLSGKSTYVHNQDLANSGAFGLKGAAYAPDGELIQRGSLFRTEFGGSLNIQFNKTLWEHVKLDTRVCLFSNYKGVLANIDVNWQMLIFMKITKFLSANVSTHLIYDDDIAILLDSDQDGVFESSGPRLQFKELFGIGLNYSF